MDYEKAYKAVLKTATQWIKDGCTDKEKICLECVFPELRESESEDERRLHGSKALPKRYKIVDGELVITGDAPPASRAGGAHGRLTIRSNL